MPVTAKEVLFECLDILECLLGLALAFCVYLSMVGAANHVCARGFRCFWLLSVGAAPLRVRASSSVRSPDIIDEAFNGVSVAMLPDIDTFVCAFAAVRQRMKGNLIQMMLTLTLKQLCSTALYVAARRWHWTHGRSSRAHTRQRRARLATLSDD